MSNEKILREDEIITKWIYHTPKLSLPECVRGAMREYAALAAQEEGIDDLKNNHTETLCDLIMNYDGKGVFASNKLQKIAENYFLTITTKTKQP